MNRRSGQWTFKQWLDRLTSADVFLKKPNSYRFYRNMPRYTKYRVRRKLRAVDPKGLSRLNAVIRRAIKKKVAECKLVPPELLNDPNVAVEVGSIGLPSTSRIRFMKLGGLKNILSIALAAGYTREEVAAMAGMTVDSFNALGVTEDDIKTATKEMPRAIIECASQKVMRDLMAGEVSKETDTADRIATRRMKLAIDAHAEQRKEDQALQEKREEHLRDRFQVDRKIGREVR